MNIFSVSENYPIGTKLRLVDDDPGIFHEVYGYERLAKGENIIFSDGTKLNIKRLVLIEEVIPCQE
ncbi:MAG: hypothetical protein ACI4DN_09215 [Lachnospiraceae bacterium]